MHFSRKERSRQAVHRARHFSALLAIGSTVVLILYSLNRLFGIGLAIDSGAALFAALMLIVGSILWAVGSAFAKTSTAAWVDSE
jgi:uncharacterized protein (DUF697 family)